MSKTAIEQALKLVKSSRRQVARMLKTVGRDCEYSESLLNPIHRELKQAQKSLESLAQYECLAIELAEAIGIDPSYEGITEFLSRRVVRPESSATELAVDAGIDPSSVKTLASMKVKDRYNLFAYDPVTKKMDQLVNNKCRRTCKKVFESQSKACALVTTSGALETWFNPVK